MINFLGLIDGLSDLVIMCNCKRSPDAYENATNSDYIPDSD